MKELNSHIIIGVVILLSQSYSAEFFVRLNKRLTLHTEVALARSTILALYCTNKFHSINKAIPTHKGLFVH